MPQLVRGETGEELVEELVEEEVVRGLRFLSWASISERMERRGPLVLGVRARRSGPVSGGPSMNFDGRMGREEGDGGVAEDMVAVDCDGLDAIVYCGCDSCFSSYLRTPKLVFWSVWSMEGLSFLDTVIFACALVSDWISCG